MRKAFSYALAGALLSSPIVAKADSVSRDAAAGAHAGFKALGVPGAVVGGAILPADGVEYYVVPDDYGVRGYRDAVINDTIVLVDPASHRIVQIVG